jgi:hypothetical protein
MRSHMRRGVLLIAIALVGAAFVAPTRADALFTPDGHEYKALTFPVKEQDRVHYSNDFMPPTRPHHGNDLMGARLLHLVAANDGEITFARSDSSGTSGNMLILTGNDGWKYWYIHINNDTPGTDDGANPSQWRFAPGIQRGSTVKKGQFIAYMGDSGNAEGTAPHVHFELHKPDDTAINPYYSLRIAQGLEAGGLCSKPRNPASAPSASAGRGFWTVSSAGKVMAFGNVQTFGQPPTAAATNPYVAVAPTPSGNGYWVVDTKGNVRGFGNAVARGGMGNKTLNQPMIGIAPTKSGNGYWLLAKDGGIFSFGDAKFYGSTGNKKLNAPIIAMASTLGGKGYWLLGADGGVFTFGDARFYGSTGAMKLAAPVVSMAATKTGAGYWLVARDGGMFSFGDAKFYGSMPGLGWCPGPQAVAMSRTSVGKGYWILLNDGRVLAFGDAKPWGQPASSGNRAVSLAGAR